MLVEVVLIVLLLVLNGVFAMSEIAVVSARKSRLREAAERGSARARRALELAENPDRFLATVQVGITMVGILAGAFGGATIAEHLAASIAAVPALEPYADALALGAVVLGITYLSLIIGELVPKRIGLNAPERIASNVAGPMRALSVIASPLVTLLTVSTEVVLRVLHVRRSDEPPVTDAEISGLMEQGTRAGVFYEEEQELVERVMWLADQRAEGVMTPRVDVLWLDVDGAAEERRRIMREHPSHHFPVCEGSLDHVVGVLDVRDYWIASADRGGAEPEIGPLLREPLIVPGSARALQVLEDLRESGVPVAVVVDEYGGTEGLLTLHDLVREVVGGIRLAGAAPEPAMVRRDDGSLLADGSVRLDELFDELGLDDWRAEERQEYRTVGGLVYTRLGRVPRAGDVVEGGRFRVEVVDMDGNRVDKVLVTPLAGGADDG